MAIKTKYGIVLQTPMKSCKKSKANMANLGPFSLIPTLRNPKTKQLSLGFLEELRR